MRHVGLGHCLLGLPVGDGQGLGGLFAQTLDASQADTHAAQLPQQFHHLPAALAEAAGENSDPGLQPGAKGASTDRGRQLRLHPDLTMGTPAGQQPVCGNDRANFGPFPDLVSFQGRSLPGRRRLQSPTAVRTGFLPILHDLSYLLGRGQLPMVALMSGLTTRMTPTFFLCGFLELEAGLAREAARNCRNGDSAWPPTR
jgi:hypothetical protein